MLQVQDRRWIALYFYPAKKVTLCVFFFSWGHTWHGWGQDQGIGQSVVCKCDILSSLSSRNAFLRLTDMPDVPNAHIRQTRLPRCKCDQHRRRRRRRYPSATGAAGHVEPLGSVAACAVFSSKPPKYPKLLHSICAPAFKDFREIMMATGPRAARVRTNAGESVGCIGLAPTGLLPSSFACSSDPGCKM